jgi:hypothetical protein
MRGRRRGEVPRPLLQAAARFAAWRRTRALGTRIPDDLWALAAELAATYGVCQTSLVLKVDYYGLKRRLKAKASAPGLRGASRPAFVELSASTLATPGECTIEFENAAGSKMRIHLKGVHTPDLLALGTSFWSNRP